MYSYINVTMCSYITFSTHTKYIVLFYLSLTMSPTVDRTSHFVLTTLSVVQRALLVHVCCVDEQLGCQFPDRW